MKILITGTAGFIGFHLAKRLISTNNEVVGLDSINDYYDIKLKHGRLNEAGIKIDEVSYNKLVQSIEHQNYRFIKLNLEDKENILALFINEKFDVVVNLAAQAGVRYSIINPFAYIESNVNGFMNILEGCRHNNVKHLLYASTSSVYGLNQKMPLSTSQSTEHPLTLYAATKKANEMMAHSYSHLYGIETTGLRFFTVYGPWGRPDMALFLFCDAILKNMPIDVFNNGEMVRDFTYVEDIVESIARLCQLEKFVKKSWDPMNPNPSTSSAPYRILNIGNSAPVRLIEYISALENVIGKKAKKKLRPIQPGDVPRTHADISDLVELIDFTPKTDIKTGIKNFVDWYLTFYQNV